MTYKVGTVQRTALKYIHKVWRARKKETRWKPLLYMQNIEKLSLETFVKFKETLKEKRKNTSK